MYRWEHQKRTGAGKFPYPNTAQALDLADAKRSIREFEEEPRAKKLVLSMLKDDGISPKGNSR